MPRKSSVIHYCESIDYFPPCGTDGRKTMVRDIVTCKRCRFHILADVAPWAREFLEELRGKTRPAESHAISIPGEATKPVHSKVERLGNGFARAFGQQPSSQKAIRELLPFSSAIRATVQPIVDNSGAPAEPVGVKEG